MLASGGRERSSKRLNITVRIRRTIATGCKLVVKIATCNYVYAVYTHMYLYVCVNFGKKHDRHTNPIYPMVSMIHMIFGKKILPHGTLY